MSISNPLIILLGPTASGKTKLAVQLASELGGEIISADSRQVFRNMNIGTGKDLTEYNFKGQHIPYHLIDIKEAGERYNVNEFKNDFYSVFERLTNENTLPILCGGTGMYMHSLLQNQEYTAIPSDSELRNLYSPMDIDALRRKLSQYPVEFTRHADLTSHKRLIRAIEVAEFLLHNDLVAKEQTLIKPFVIGLNPELTTRRLNIVSRLESRFEEGLIAEVENLISRGLSFEILDYYGLEYKLIGEYLRKDITFSELKERLIIAICQFAKRQMTFFRKMEKDGVKINWFSTDVHGSQLFDNVLHLIKTSNVI